MKERTLTMPEIALIAVTRVALGAGIGLLLSRKFDDRECRGAGWVLVAVGAATTVPLLVGVLQKRSQSSERLAA
jgi:hypothetical protein